jgi:hypothetical protein
MRSEDPIYEPPETVPAQAGRLRDGTILAGESFSDEAFRLISAKRAHFTDCLFRACTFERCNFQRCDFEWFFAEQNAERKAIDYRRAVAGGLRLVPRGEAREIRADDYRNMVEDGLLLDEAEPFEVLIDRISSLEERTNAAAAARRA